MEVSRIDPDWQFVLLKRKVISPPDSAILSPIASPDLLPAEKEASCLSCCQMVAKQKRN